MSAASFDEFRARVDLALDKVLAELSEERVKGSGVSAARLEDLQTARRHLDLARKALFKVETEPVQVPAPEERPRRATMRLTRRS